MENNQKQELTLKEIFKKIFKHKIVVLAVTLVIAIVGTLFLGVLPNRNKTYSSTYQLSMTTSGAFGLPNGTFRNYTNIVSLENLKEVKSKNADYKDIDVDKIYKGKDVSIIREVEEETDIVSYTIKINADYFEDEIQASNFIEDAIKNLYDVKLAVDAERDNYSSNYNSNVMIESKLDAIKGRLNEIKSAYDSAISTYGDLVVNGKALSVYRQEIINELNGLKFTLFDYELRDEKYAETGDNFVTYYNSQITYYQDQKTYNENEIEKLKQESSGLGSGINDSTALEPFYSAIKELIRANQDLDKTLEKLNKKLEYAQGTVYKDEARTEIDAEALNRRNTYVTKLDEYSRNEVNDFNQDYYDVVQVLYDNGLKIEYEDFTPIKVDGEKNIIMMAVISLILGVVAGCVVAYVVEIAKNSKEESESQEVESQESNS